MEKRKVQEAVAEWQAEKRRRVEDGEEEEVGGDADDEDVQDVQVRVCFPKHVVSPVLIEMANTPQAFEGFGAPSHLCFGFVRFVVLPSGSWYPMNSDAEIWATRVVGVTSKRRVPEFVFVRASSRFACYLSWSDHLELFRSTSLFIYTEDSVLLHENFPTRGSALCGACSSAVVGLLVGLCQGGTPQTDRAWTAVDTHRGDYAETGEGGICSKGAPVKCEELVPARGGANQPGVFSWSRRG